MPTVKQTLGPDGLLAEHIAQFSPRQAQQLMAERVQETMAVGGALVVEAGTGTGKTFAYLVPALLSDAKVIISTATRTLQDQLFLRDLPTVKELLGSKRKTALLKGRSNYLCLHRLQASLRDQRHSSSKHQHQLFAIDTWAQQTQSGDIAEITDGGDAAILVSDITSTTDNCLGQECDYFSDCFVVKARRLAQDADILVINHHLLFADMVLKEEGFGELLPGVDCFIMDEAHALPEIATHFCGISLSSRQLLDLVKDTWIEMSETERPAGRLLDSKDALEKAIMNFRLNLALDPIRLPWQPLLRKKTLASGFAELKHQLEAFSKRLEPLASHSKGLEACWRRAQEYTQRLALLGKAQDEENIQWIDVHKKGFSLHITPLDIAPIFRAHMHAQDACWIFTSATLAVGQRFDYFVERLGLADANTVQLSSEFDFKKNALLYLPEQMPDPNDQHYTEAVVDAALPVIKASGGGCFMLFTSHRALKNAAELLQGRLSYPILVQGELPTAKLLAHFRRLGNAVLLGTASFWEGVDVRGPALSCVIIDKLPFASPGDPILQAKIEHIRMAGGNAFFDYQMPNAVIALKQGFGRLIRDANDRGVMMLCDPRLIHKSYGKIFLRSLPDMQCVRSLDVVEAFFNVE